MSLFVQVAVGDGLYLLDAAQVVEICPSEGDAGDAPRRLPVVDLRRLFAAPAAPQGSRLRIADAVLIVDRIDGLAEIDAASFRALPAIGPLGDLIDGVAMRPGIARPVLRLRAERAPAVAAARG